MDARTHTHTNIHAHTHTHTLSPAFSLIDQNMPITSCKFNNAGMKFSYLVVLDGVTLLVEGVQSRVVEQIAERYLDTHSGRHTNQETRLQNGNPCKSGRPSTLLGQIDDADNCPGECVSALISAVTEFFLDFTHAYMQAFKKSRDAHRQASRLSARGISRKHRFSFGKYYYEATVYYCSLKQRSLLGKKFLKKKPELMKALDAYAIVLTILPEANPLLRISDMSLPEKTFF
jgi:hypothetical protein